MAGNDSRDNCPHNYINSDDDIINVIDLDEEELLDANEIDEEGQSRIEDCDATPSNEIDDSIHCFLGHQGPIYSVACNPILNSRQVATGGEDDLVYLWQVGDGEVHHKLQGHTDSVTSLEFSKDGRLLASGGMDGVVNIWESSSATLKQKLEGPSGTIEWLQWHPDGNLLLAGSDDFSSWLWDPNTGSCMEVLLGHNGMVTCGSFTPDGELICTGSDDGSLRIWRNSRSSGSNSIHVVEGGHQFHSDFLTCVSISNDSHLAITGSTDTKACLVNIQSGIPVATLTGHLDSIQCATFLYGAISNLATTCALDGRLIVWDVQTSTIRNICEHEHEVLQLQWCPTTQLICSGSSDGKVRLWDHRTGHCERVLQGHFDKIQGLALSSDGSIIVSGSDDHTARVFELSLI